MGLIETTQNVGIGLGIERVNDFTYHSAGGVNGLGCLEFSKFMTGSWAYVQLVL